MTEGPRPQRRNIGFSREGWREYKRKHGIVTDWDRYDLGITKAAPPRPRSEYEIRADLAAMLAEQLKAQRKRWGLP